MTGTQGDPIHYSLHPQTPTKPPAQSLTPIKLVAVEREPAAAAEYCGIGVVVGSPTTPSIQRRPNFLWKTLKLIPFHLFNFVLGTLGFVVAVTGISVAAGTLPVCGLGILVYLFALQLTRLLVVWDVLLANSISDVQARWDVPDAPEEDHVGGLRLASRLTRFSLRSTMVMLYFLTIKFALGVVGLVVVLMPILPIASQIVADHTDGDAESYVAGWNVKDFTFQSSPYLYVLACVGYFIVGIGFMHVMGKISSSTTRSICCEERINETSIA